jgi:hypothetical protein
MDLHSLIVIKPKKFKKKFELFVVELGFFEAFSLTNIIAMLTLNFLITDFSKMKQQRINPKFNLFL